MSKKGVCQIVRCLKWKLVKINLIFFLAKKVIVKGKDTFSRKEVLQLFT